MKDAPNPCFLSTLLLALIVVASSSAIITALKQPKTDHREDHSGQESSAQGQKEAFWQRTANDPVAVFTLVLTGFTGILAIYTGVMGHATRRLVRNADDTAERQLRAYVGIKTANMSVDVRNGRLFAKCSFKLENGGLTPAYHVRSTVGIVVAEGFTPEVEQQAQPVVGQGYLFREASQSIHSHSSDITPIDAYSEIFVFGAITYFDAFQKQRSTKFRLMAANLDMSGGTASLAACDEGNEAN